jgi:hypothetical protein
MINDTVPLFSSINNLKLKFPAKSLGIIHSKFCTLDTLEIQQ